MIEQRIEGFTISPTFFKSVEITRERCEVVDFISKNCLESCRSALFLCVIQKTETNNGRRLIIMSCDKYNRTIVLLYY